MGTRWSNPASEPSTEAWRSITWGHNERDLQIVNDYQPYNKEIQHLKVLLLGPAGSGKSIFISSVESALQGKIGGPAWARAISEQSFTKQYRTYRIHKGGPGTFYPFAFCDITCLEGGRYEGAGVEDIKLALKGHIRDGYIFRPWLTISEDSRRYITTPTLQDQVHVLVFVISANTVRFLCDESVKEMREVRLAATDMGIPQLAILTKIDQTCPEVNADIRNVYKSKKIKEMVDELSLALDLTPNCIFPVKNYHSEIETDSNTDALILSALRYIITHGENFVNGLQA